MAKEIQAMKKLYLSGGKATPGPPVGTALQGLAVKGVMVAKGFNDITQDRVGKVVPVMVTCYTDGTFDLKLFQEPIANMIKEQVGGKGSGEPNKNKVGKLNRSQLEKMAEMKMVDLNASDMNSAIRMIEGTARSMGVEIER